MADEIDRTQARLEAEMARLLPPLGYELPPGAPGECEMCGEWSGRLVDGACAPCRDKYGLG